MPQNVNRATVALYDQDEEETIADWGGDELFTRMPSRRPVDDAPAPRFRPSLALVEPPHERRFARPGDERAGVRGETSAPAIAERRERTHLSAVAEPPPAPEGPRFARAEPAPAEGGEPAPTGAPTYPVGAEAPTIRRWDGSPLTEPPVRPTRVITGRPGEPPRAGRAYADRPRRAQTPSDWIGARPERIVAWAFALGLLLILVAISTADAATV